MTKARIGITCFLLGFAFLTTAQIRFEATTNAKKVIVDRNFEVSFTLHNSRSASNFQAPNFKNIKIIGPPMQSSSSSTINGARSSSVSIIYNLRGMKVGTARIGPAKIEVDGEVYETEPLLIEVVPGRPPGSDNDLEDIYYRADPIDTIAYVGQQVALDFNLYMQADYIKERYVERNLPEFDGLYYELVNWYRVNQDVFGGEPYNIWTLRRFAVYPQREGPLSIGSMNLDLNVSNRNDPMGLFSRPIRSLKLSTTPLSITGKPLPPGAPPSFTGAVGQWRCSARSNKRALTTDEAISIEISISGNGDIKRVGNPILDWGDSLEVYEPNIIKEESVDVRGTMMHERIVEYLITPLHPGTYELPIRFSYFDPDSAKYITLEPQRFKIQVARGTGVNNNTDTEEAEVANKPTLRGIKEKTRLRTQGSYFVGSPLFWSFTGAPFVLFTGLFFWRQARRRKDAIPEEVLRMRHADRVAQQRLAKAKKHLDTNSIDPFYDEVSQAMLGYISDKLQIPNSQLTKDNVRDTLKGLSLSDDLEADFMDVLRICEIARFAGMGNAEGMNTTYEKAKKALSSIEDRLKPQ